MHVLLYGSHSGKCYRAATGGEIECMLPPGCPTKHGFHVPRDQCCHAPSVDHVVQGAAHRPLMIGNHDVQELGGRLAGQQSLRQRYRRCPSFRVDPPGLAGQRDDQVQFIQVRPHADLGAQRLGVVAEIGLQDPRQRDVPPHRGDTAR
jgi:hypothetical protein